ncbi:MAG: glycerophosphodiester phosphodiesterase [Clostridia bacterium]|nr:glycerophosphodiester phosphodiesterase [Clostridia bacterium]
MAGFKKLRGRKFSVPHGFTVTAHSGCMGLSENSIEAMEAGVAAGAQIVEFDLRFTSRGEPVLSHDEPVGECVPLREAFAFLAAHPGIRANVDVKTTEHLECVAPMARQAGVLDRIFFTGICVQDVPAVREKCPDVPYYLNVKVPFYTRVEKLAAKTRALGAVGVNVSAGNLSERLTRYFRQNGLLTSVWTIDSARKARRVLPMQPDNVTTRWPDRIAESVEKRDEA